MKCKSDSWNRIQFWLVGSSISPMSSESYIFIGTTLVAARSNLWFWGISLTGIAGSKLAGSMEHLCVVNVVCCQAEVSASGWSLVEGVSTDCSASMCDRKASIIRWFWPTGNCCNMVRKRICTQHCLFFATYYPNICYNSILVAAFCLSNWKLSCVKL